MGHVRNDYILNKECSFSLPWLFVFQIIVELSRYSQTSYFLKKFLSLTFINAISVANREFSNQGTQKIRSQITRKFYSEACSF